VAVARRSDGRLFGVVPRPVNVELDRLEDRLLLGESASDVHGPLDEAGGSAAAGSWN
jgi:hypothetical protein